MSTTQNIIITSNLDARWTRGIVTEEPTGRSFYFEALVFDEPSEFGIECGTVSKLWLGTTKETASRVYEWDRGPILARQELSDLEAGNLAATIAAAVAAARAAA